MHLWVAGMVFVLVLGGAGRLYQCGIDYGVMVKWLTLCRFWVEDLAII